MITVTEVQEQARAAELHKRRQAERIGHDMHPDPHGGREQPRQLPSVPTPADEHVQWAKRILGEGWQAPVDDRTAALRILDAAGVDPRPYHAGREPDSAPPGARDVAQAHLERDLAEADRTARKAANVRGFEEGPGEGLSPGHPQPASFSRPYVQDGHAARSPEAEGPRANPMPGMQHVVLPNQPRAAAIPQHVIEHFTMGSPGDTGGR